MCRIALVWSMCLLLLESSLKNFTWESKCVTNPNRLLDPPQEMSWESTVNALLEALAETNDMLEARKLLFIPLTKYSPTILFLIILPTPNA